MLGFRHLSLVALMGGLAGLSGCGSTGNTQPEQFTVGEIMARCTSQFCRVFNSTQAGRESAKANRVTVFVPQDNSFSAYMTARGIRLESLLGTPAGEALVKAHTTLQTVPFPVPQGGAILRALDGRTLEVRAVNTDGTLYTVAGVPVVPAGTDGGAAITNGNVLDILGVIQ